MIFLEDDDVAAIQKGCLSIHRIKRTMDESTIREVITLKMELQEIMKGKVVTKQLKQLFRNEIVLLVYVIITLMA